jgi:RNA polymerase sigma-70 factor (ECF subfamily)
MAVLTDNISLELLIKTNPEKAFELIYQNYYETFCRIAYKIVVDKDAAEDVVQEVLLEFWNKKEQIEITSSIQGYLRRSVYYRSLNHIKQKSKFTEDENALLNHENDDESIEEKMYASEMQEKIDKVIESLPEKCRYAFALSRYEQKTYNEIAEIMEISVKTVENQISKALRILRSAMLVSS